MAVAPKGAAAFFCAVAFDAVLPLIGHVPYFRT